MRVLIINQFFWPDLAPTGRYLYDLTEYLCKEGHEVTVICSGQSYVKTDDSNSNRPLAKIIRVFGPSFKRGTVARLLSYSSFMAGAVWKSMSVPRPDMVVTMTTPPLLAITGTLMRSIRNTRHFIWEMDVFPDTLIGSGTLSDQSMLSRILQKIQTFVRSHSDGVIALGPCMRARLISSGTPAHLLHVAENWADGIAIAPGAYREAAPLHVLYSGNLGLTHDIDTIAAVMDHFRNDDRFLFTFAGGGIGNTRLKQRFASGPPHNIRFLPYASQETINQHFGDADIGLVTQLPACLGTVVPSKVYTLLAAGRPILFVGPKQATPALLIERTGCGWQIDPGDSETLVHLLERLIAGRQEISTRGYKARQVFEETYDVSHGVARIAAALGLGEADLLTTTQPIEVTG
jgi:colanic acid biosynthesis glycosyl transferase WcaI